MIHDLFPREFQGANLPRAGELANGIASRYVFQDYRSRKAKNTLIRQDNDLALFKAFLREVDLNPGDFSKDPDAWRGITWGLVEGFIRWQLGRGFAVSSVNVRLSTIKAYAKLAAKAEVLSAQEYALIRFVQGYAHKEMAHIDELRAESGLNTRLGAKKSQPVHLTSEQIAALKRQADTPQGRRDALLICLLLDHGLRVGEVAKLKVTNFDLKAGELRFYRPKVNRIQVHRLTADTLRAAKTYLEKDALSTGPVLRASYRGLTKGKARLTHAGLSERAIKARVCELGAVLNIEGLSPHDCRHAWATKAARNHTPLDRLQDAGGWSSPAMPLRYVELAAIANEGVKLGDE